ncbi:MAG: Glu/Leu/Phe/Val dehydrogenase dimerization domain-containing protein [Pseudomonadota bacterium]
MAVFTNPAFDSHETVHFARDPAAGLTAIIAVHSTALGPALGGCRIWPYADEAAALTDVLRLSRGMSYKAALAGLPLGGGKSVILADSRRDKTPAMMRAMGRAIQRLGGAYIVAEDVGATVADMDAIAAETAHVSGTSATAGDPSPWTARGVALSLEAAARLRLGQGVEGLAITVLGLGSVGGRLATILAERGARLTVADIDAARAAAVAAATGARVVAPDAAHAAPADVFAPCALGAGLNARTIPQIAARLVCGAANNQLETAEDDVRLAARGILYCPDYLVNAGGLISVARPALAMDDRAAEARLAAIPETLRSLLAEAEARGTPPGAAADRLARARMVAPSSAGTRPAAG